MATKDSRFAQMYRQELAKNRGFLGLFSSPSRTRTSGNSSSVSDKIANEKLTRIDINGKISAKNSMVLPAMARDMNLMRLNMQKMVTLSGGKASIKADMFFKRAQERESAYESQFKKQSLLTKIDGKGKSVDEQGQKGIFGNILSFSKDFLGGVLKFILSPGILKTLLGAGIAGTIFNFLDEDTKNSIRNFLKNILIGLFNGITTTFREIKDLLSNSEVKQSFQTAIQAIFDTIVAGFKLALSTKVNTPLGEFSLVTVLAGVIGSFVALKVAIATLVSAILRSSGKLILGGTTDRQRSRNRSRPRASGSGRGRAAVGALAAYGVGNALVEGYDALFGEDENDLDSIAREDMQGVPGTTPGEIGNPTTFDNIITGGLLGLDAAGSASILGYGISKLPAPPTGSVPRTLAPVRPMAGPTPGFLTPFGTVGQNRELEKNKNMLEKIASLIKKIGEKIGPAKLVVYMWKRLAWKMAAKLTLAVAGIVAAPFSAGLSLLISAIGAGLLARDLYEIYDFLTTLEKEIDSENTTSPQRIDASATSSAALTSPTIVPSGSREAIESYLGRKISDQENDMLYRAVYAESSRNRDEYANVMAVILNRARASGGNNSISDVLLERNQFQAVTGTPNNRQPSANYLRGPNFSESSMIAEAATQLLPKIPTSRDAFTAANRRAYGVGTDVGHLDRMIAAGGTQIGQTIFNENQYRPGRPGTGLRSMPAPIAAAPKTNLPETAPETSIFADLEKMMGAVFAAIGDTNNAVQAAVAAATRPAQQTANGPIPSPYDSQLFETLLRHHTELGSSIGS